VRGKLRDCLFTVFGEIDLAGLTTEIGADQKPVIGRIFGDQDAFPGCRRR
jgi:hypothetical protein